MSDQSQMIDRQPFSTAIGAALRRFVRCRALELSYGSLFGSVFLLCQSPLHALVVDDIRVLSRLGEPLVAEVNITPATGEVLSRSCFRARQGNGDLPEISNVRLQLSRSLGAQVLRISSSQPMREPLNEFTLQVKCPGVPTIIKTFLVMVDPPGLNRPEQRGIAANNEAQRPFAPATPVVATSGRRDSADGTTGLAPATADLIAPGSRYRVRNGDMLSTIASRVSPRPEWTVWPIAKQIYAANPGAFLLGNPNMIAEGATIYIPTLDQVDMSATSSLRPKAGTSPAVASTPAQDAVPQFVQTEVAEINSAAVAAPAIAIAIPNIQANTTTESEQPVATTTAQLPAATQAIAQPAPIVLVATRKLKAMQLTPVLFEDSRVKLELRRQGNPVVTANNIAPEATQTGVDEQPKPQAQPEPPNNAVTSSRDALPARGGFFSGWLGWLAFALGLIGAFALGSWLSKRVLREQLAREYDEDLRETLHARHMQPNAPASPVAPQTAPRAATEAAIAAVAPVIAGSAARTATDDNTLELNISDLELPATHQEAPESTVEVNSLDLELPLFDEPATVGEPETLEMPKADLDLELPKQAATGARGQHEVDFDLLEQAYTDEYQAEFVNQPDKSPVASTGADAANNDKSEDNRYYHLENRDPADEAPLPIELGEDEMSGDEQPGKIVNFPSSKG